MQLLRHRSFQIIVAIGLYLLLAPWLPIASHQGLYAISLLIKDLLLWILPVTVGLFIANAIASFEKKAPLFIFALFVFEGLSNTASVWYAYLCGHIAAFHLPSIEPHAFIDNFTPLWRMPPFKPTWWSADKGTLIGIVVGLITTLRFHSFRKVIARTKANAEWVLTKVFSRLIPLFVLGFVARMYQTKLLTEMFLQYTDLLAWMLFFLLAYIAFIFFLGSGPSKFLYLRSIKNLLPAAGVAFSSGCSLSTMPWTIEGAAKNLHNKDLARAIIPATTNIQQVGDCIANTFLCFLIYRQFNGENPDLYTWIPFSIVFVLARYATAAVLGGAIFIMIPIYESYLGFNAEMIALILAFNVLLDPIITCTNVIGNGALCRVFEKAWGFLLRKPISMDR